LNGPTIIIYLLQTEGILGGGAPPNVAFPVQATRALLSQVFDKLRPVISGAPATIKTTAATHHQNTRRRP